MAADIKRCTDFLQSLDTKDIPHTGGGFFDHLVAVYRDLRSWGYEEPVFLAGLFHSIYGTEGFRDFTLPFERRDEVRRLIGENAERIAFINCVMDRTTFDGLVRDGGERRVRNRVTREWITMTELEFHDLRVVHLCDWLEQVGRCQDWNYRRDVFRTMADQLGGIPKTSYDRVFAEEPAVDQASQSHV